MNHDYDFLLGFLVGAIAAIVVSMYIPFVQIAIDEANHIEVGQPGPCTSLGTGEKLESPSTDWYKENCFVSMNSSFFMVDRLYYKDACACYEYEHRGFVTRFWEIAEKVL